MQVGVIGCDVLGRSRARMLADFCSLAACSDMNVDSAVGLAKNYGAKVFRDWRDLVWLEYLDIIIVTSSDYLLIDILNECIGMGKFVWVDTFDEHLSMCLKRIINTKAPFTSKVTINLCIEGNYCDNEFYDFCDKITLLNV